MPNGDTVLPITALEFDPQNARKRTERSSAVIRESLQQFGPLRSLVGQRLPDGRIIVRAGNGTLAEAGEIGIDKVRIVERRPDELVVVVADDIDEDQWKSYAIADNRASDLSDWDTDVLEELSQDIDLSSWFTEDEQHNWIFDKPATSRFSSPDEDQDIPSIMDGGFPLAIVLNPSELKEWNTIKESVGASSDKALLLMLMRGEV
jgi:hypothetical protein